MKKKNFFLGISLTILSISIISPADLLGAKTTDKTLSGFAETETNDPLSGIKDNFTTNDGFNLLLGVGGGYFGFPYPYAEIGFNYNKIYLTGELGYLWLGGYVALYLQYEFFRKNKYSFSLIGDYGIFGGVGIQTPINIAGGGVEYRVQPFRSKTQILGRLTLQWGINEELIPLFQCGIRFKI
ncbi:hypothetical protein KGY73_10610 [bacterium]|nr:hypothetical protein [bacterium]